MAKKRTKIGSKKGEGLTNEGLDTPGLVLRDATSRKENIAKKTVDGKEYPKGVLCTESWDKYELIMSSEMLANPEVETSINGLSINIKGTAYTIKKQGRDLPEEERTKLLAMNKVARSYIIKAQKFKKKAFNETHRGRYSFQESILDSKSSELIEYFGRYYNVNEVHKVVVMEWGMDVTYDVVKQFRDRHLDLIKQEQEKFTRDYSDIRLGHKRSRLDELQYLYNHRKSKYELSNSKEDYKLLLQTIEQIRKEVEGDKLVIDGNIQMNVEHTVNSHIQNEVMKTVAINDIIIGRLAAKIGVDSRVLTDRLHKSYYAKFTGFNTASEGDLDDEPIYPSKFVYNFDDLARQAQNQKIEEAKVIELIPKLTDGQKGEMKDVKSILLQRIRDKKQEINKAQDRTGNIKDKKHE